MSGALRVPAAGAVRARWARSLHPPPGGSGPPPRPPAQGPAGEDPSRPFPFAPSGAHPFRWTVLHSLREKRQRSGRKVLPVTFSLLAVVVWCYLREEGGADRRWRRALRGEAPAPGPGAEQLAAPAARVAGS
ncbi:ubiquinol-cytochrome c reductase complex assembly factor 4 [Dipodomys merriami]|uniref:ubiquinol-cytochrome c reductase complex assembly factor 4-like n=1 Tax=Dipodomys merriami TaxID=94247 RepID=UPI00385570F0